MQPANPPPTVERMNLFDGTAKLMTMSDQAWARHANPWSVYTRMATLPLAALAVWSRLWLGWWALIPIGLVIFWVWINPRLFGVPARTDNWASKVTFGERVFLNRKAVPIPAAHVRWGYGLSAVSGLGLLPLAFGLWRYDLSLTLLGLVLTIGAKLWFVDRMVFLYDAMKDADPTYAGWLR